MFTVLCPHETAEVLLWPTNVTALRNTDEGIEVTFRCHCGHLGRWRTGRHGEERLTSLAG